MDGLVERSAVKINVASHNLSRIVVLLVSCLSFATAFADTLPLPSGLVGFDSDAGAQLFVHSAVRKAYWPLSIQFVTQKNQAYCGVATAVMVLNALHVPAPVSQGIEPYKIFTQDNVLNGETEKILPQSVLADNGMTIDQFGQILDLYGVVTEVYHADQSNLEHFRITAANYLNARNRYVVVNYLRNVLGQEGGGHISALAAYDVSTDRFLVLDVSRYKYPPVWVRATKLFAAMNTVDVDNKGRHRGFVLIRHDS